MGNKSAWGTRPTTRREEGAGVKGRGSGMYCFVSLTMSPSEQSGPRRVLEMISDRKPRKGRWIDQQRAYNVVTAEVVISTWAQSLRYPLIQHEGVMLPKGELKRANLELQASSMVPFDT